MWFHCITCLRYMGAISWRENKILNLDVKGSKGMVVFVTILSFDTLIVQKTLMRQRQRQVFLSILSLRRPKSHFRFSDFFSAFLSSALMYWSDFSRISVPNLFTSGSYRKNHEISESIS